VKINAIVGARLMNTSTRFAATTTMLLL